MCCCCLVYGWTVNIDMISSSGTGNKFKRHPKRLPARSFDLSYSLSPGPWSSSLELVYISFLVSHRREQKFIFVFEADTGQNADKKLNIPPLCLVSVISIPERPSPHLAKAPIKWDFRFILPPKAFGQRTQ